MSYTGVNFRSTAAFVADPSAYTYALTSDVFGSSGVTRGGITFGYTGSAAFHDNSSSSVDARIAGAATVNTYNVAFRLDLPNGLYKFQIGAGHLSVGVNNAIYIWDGAFRDYTANVALSSTNVIDYPASASVAIGKYVLRAAKLYRCSTAGTTANNPPSGTGTTTDGTVVWSYVRSALFASIATTSGSALIVDAAGNTWTSSVWPGSQVATGSLAVSKGFVTVTRGETGGWLRSLAFETQPTPLQDVTLGDADDATMGTSPTIYAGQPFGKFAAKLRIPIGAQTAANFAVSGTLGGNAASYFQCVQKGGDVWLVGSCSRLPDSATGTIVITQIDGSAGVSGSPRSTTFTPTIISSQGRPIDATAMGQISTECYLQHRQVADRVGAAWAGYNGQSFSSGHDLTASTPAELMSRLDSFLPDAGNGVWFRVRLQNGSSWANQVTLPSYDFLKDGTGGVLIEPDTGHDPAIDGRWTGTAPRGFHFRGLLATGNGAAAYNEWLRVDRPAGTSFATMIVSDCRLYGKDWVQDTFCPGWYAIRVFGAELLRVRDCRFRGFDNAIDAIDCHLFESNGNDFQQNIGDIHGTSNSCAMRGKFSDENMYTWIHANTVRNVFQKYQNAPFTSTNGPPHADFNQERTTVSYPLPNSGNDPTLSKAVILGQHAAINGNLYKCIQEGTTAGDGVGPTGTSPSITDGSATWQYICSLESAPKMIKSTHDNIVQAGGTYYEDYGTIQRYHPNMQFIIHSNVGMPVAVSCFNNVVGSSVVRGFLRETSLTSVVDFLEHNTLVGPAILPPAPSFGGGSFAQSIKIGLAPGFTAAKKIRARKNLVGGIDTAGVFDEDNKLTDYLPGASPPSRYVDALIGPFSQNGDDYTIYSSLQDDGANTAAEFREDMTAVLATSATTAGLGAIPS